jgi:hypothetical protein
MPPEGNPFRDDLEARERAIRTLWRLDEGEEKRLPYVWAVLDAARDERIYPTLCEFAKTREVMPLYSGRSATELAAVAPYLVCLGNDDVVFDWIWREGWTQHWGIFLWSSALPQRLREHFRRLTMVRTEDGETLLFRFYDPRVLSAFLPTCDEGQRRQVFGVVERFWAGPGADHNRRDFSFHRMTSYDGGMDPAKGGLHGDR